MGGASSVMTVEQQTALSKQLKESYEICKADNLEDEIIQSTLESQYRKLLLEYSPAPVEQAPVSTSAPSKMTKAGSDLSKRLAEKSEKGRVPSSLSASSRDKEVSGKQRPTRRRSFDQAIKKIGKESDVVNALKNMSEISKSAATLEITPIPEVVDSWESVTQQPFCTVCQMAFKSLAFLDRHVKYSDLHTKNVIKQQVGDSSNSGEVNGTIAEDESVPQTTSPTKDTLAAKFTSKQVEGTHYKLLYTGEHFLRNFHLLQLTFLLHPSLIRLQVFLAHAAHSAD